MRHDRNIVLIGMPGSGKSTVGVILAKTLGMDFVDTDLLICKREGSTLQEILDSKGLEEFLNIEERTALDTDLRGTVIATGGSVPLRDAAMEHLRKNGTIVFLDVPLPELERRISNIVTRGIAFAPGQTLADIYAIRLPIYRRWADISVVAGSGETTTEQMVEQIIANQLD
jgi:shikimate kinase